MTMTHLEALHRELLKRPPQGQDAMPTLHMTSQMLAQKAVQFEVWKLRMTSLQQRMQNIINLVRNNHHPCRRNQSNGHCSLSTW